MLEESKCERERECKLKEVSFKISFVFDNVNDVDANQGIIVVDFDPATPNGINENKKME